MTDATNGAGSQHWKRSPPFLTLEDVVQFMVISRRRIERFSKDQFDVVTSDETTSVRSLYMGEVVRQIWLRRDVAGACFIIEAGDTAEAHRFVDDLPMARSGLSEFQIVPLQPYPGFGSTSGSDTLA